MTTHREFIDAKMGPLTVADLSPSSVGMFKATIHCPDCDGTVYEAHLELDRRPGVVPRAVLMLACAGCRAAGRTRLGTSVYEIAQSSPGGTDR